mmetsp:Transcript_40451/g.29122  ORF Transcript_40451/g.29122 Transcript_40451/m.29122 type:complete len:222 (-) Transcript_40451:611-1276(-)
MVNKYQVKKNSPASRKLSGSSTAISVLIVPPSVLKNKVPRGEYYYGVHVKFMYSSSMSSGISTQLFTAAVTKKKLLAVAREKRQVSRIFSQGFVIFFLRHSPNLVFTKTKNAPRHPQTNPRRIAAGKSVNALVYWVNLPNLSTPESESVTGAPAFKEVNTVSVNVLIPEQKKILQSILNDQKVVGLETSYANNDPPIGAPNAALTPADAPAAINVLLSASF